MPKGTPKWWIAPIHFKSNGNFTWCGLTGQIRVTRSEDEVSCRNCRRAMDRARVRA